ncbi:MAG: YnbE family lipoprotein [Alphaproteobacteria bacterium]|nr:MAG: YnbE family lipoprotein [Alphaproteobacteria bacterium]
MTTPGKSALVRRFALSGLIAAGVVTGVGACTPTVRLQVDPIQIYAKLDADVRVRLDQELQDLLRENPNLF